MKYKILSANIESRAVSPTLWQNIRKHNPDVVVVQQAYRARAWLKTLRGYKSYHEIDRKGGEWNGVAVLVRKDIQVVNIRHLVMTEPWTGGKAGKRHEPRVYPVVRLRKGVGEDLYVVGVHLPTFNDKDAQAESFREIEEYFKAHENGSVVAVGDWNNEASNPGIRNIVDAVDGRYNETGKVDGMLSARVKYLGGGRVPFPRYAHGWGVHTVQVPNKKD
jgi:endonuclease/exonuclease/phosphatase family metal-dependent hydrolase